MSATELTWPKQESPAGVLPLFEASPLAWAECDGQGNVSAPG